MNKQNRVECPDCHYITGKFCLICDGRGFTTPPYSAPNAVPDFLFPRHVVEQIAAELQHSNAPTQTPDRKLAYQSPDPEGEKRRLAALNLAMNAYHIANCPGMFGSPANNAMLGTYILHAQGGVECVIDEAAHYTPLDSLVRSIHPLSSGEEWFMIGSAYFDESADGTYEKLFVMGSWVGHYRVWAKFEARWREILETYGIREFHAVECAHGNGEFASKSRDERDAICSELIQILKESEIGGVASGLELATYKKMRSELKKKFRLPEGKGWAVKGALDNPFFPVFLQSVKEVIKLAKAAGLPDTEKIDLVFDHNNETSARALAFYNHCKAHPSSEFDHFRSNTNAIAFNDSHAIPSLQAADMLAYEFFCHRTNIEARAPDRWQWVELQPLVQSVGIIPDSFARDFLPGLLAQF